MGIGLTIQKEGQMPFIFDLKPYYQMLLEENTEEMILLLIAEKYLDQSRMMQDLPDFDIFYLGKLSLGSMKIKSPRSSV